MGKVFTPEQVAVGDYPEPGAHERAGRLALSLLTNQAYLFQGDDRELHQQTLREVYGDGFVEFPAAQAAMVYGSTAMGTANRRSDVDILAVYRADGAPNNLRYMQAAFRIIETMFKTPVEAHIVAANFLDRPNYHTLDPLFRAHLSAVQYMQEPQWSIEWPLDMATSSMGDITITPEATRELAWSYVAAKQRYFAKVLIKGDTMDAAAMQRALELPGSIGRKVVPAMMTQDISDATISGSRAALQNSVDRLLAVAPDDQWSHINIKEASRLQTQLRETDAYYSELLETTISGQTPLAEYERVLTENCRELLEAAHYVSTAWLKVLDDKYPLQNIPIALPSLKRSEPGDQLDLFEQVDSTTHLATISDNDSFDVY